MSVKYLLLSIVVAEFSIENPYLSIIFWFSLLPVGRQGMVLSPSLKLR